MAFLQKIHVPRQFQWSSLGKKINDDLVELKVNDPKEREQVVLHAAYLIRMQSWEEGIDWDVHRNEVTVSIPNTLYSKSVVYDGQVKYDGLSAILRDIYHNHSANKVLQFFSLDVSS